VQGKNLANRRSARRQKAIESFEQSIRLDPNYARAYAGLAYTHHTLGIQPGSARVQNEKAMQVIKKALELDSNMGGSVRGSRINKFPVRMGFRRCRKGPDDGSRIRAEQRYGSLGACLFVRRWRAF
jgi:tetratricopeptide (TPR) repeat protein